MFHFLIGIIVLIGDRYIHSVGCMVFFLALSFAKILENEVN